MFNKKTVFVIGAGASAEYGLPVGTALAEIIRVKMNIRYEGGLRLTESGDPRLWENVRASVERNQTNELLKAFWKIRDGVVYAASIDDFLDRHQNDPLVIKAGKAAIVRSILEEESKSSLIGLVSAPASVNSNNGAWLLRLFRMMATGADPDNVFDRVSFIVFNYDRAIEHFIAQAVQNFYSLDHNSTPIHKLKVIHPYGLAAAVEQLPFGSGPPNSNGNWSKLSEQIFTYTERVSDPALLTSIESEIRSAEQLVFLGFGYHQQNLNLLSAQLENVAVYGTAYRESEANQSVIRTRIANLHEPEWRFLAPQLYDGTASQFLDHYRLALLG